MDSKLIKKRRFLISVLLFFIFVFFSIAVYQQAEIERKNSIIRTITANMRVYEKG